MAICPVCDFCEKELVAFGAILFSPPNKKARVKKLHVCQTCYKLILKLRGHLANIKVKGGV